MLHIVAPGATEQHETIADGLHHFGVQLLGKLGGGFLGGQARTVLYRALDELVLLITTPA